MMLELVQKIFYSDIVYFEFKSSEPSNFCLSEKGQSFESIANCYKQEANFELMRLNKRSDKTNGNGKNRDTRRKESKQ